MRALRRAAAVLLALAALMALPAGALAAAGMPTPAPAPVPTVAPLATPRPTGAPAPTLAPMGTIAPTSTAAPLTTPAPSFLDKLLSGDNATTTNIAILLTVLSLAPSLLIMLTGFTRIIIVLSFTRTAMGTQSMPPNQVLVGLALFLTLFVMSPVVDKVYADAYQPMAAGEITMQEAARRAEAPISEFMMRQTYSSDMKFFMDTAQIGPVESASDIPFRVAVPAFITSEIKRAFYIGFMIYIPFIVIDMVVASTLMSMGMMMLPPSMISLPFKVLLFILVDGWQLTIGTLITSFL